MNTERNNRNTDKKHIVLLCVALFLLLAGLFILSRRIYLYIKQGDSPSLITDSNNSQDIIDSKLVTHEYSFEINADDPLSDIPELKNYSCSVIISSYNRRSSFSLFEVKSYEGKFRIDGNGRTVIFDGNTLYISSTVYEIKKTVENCTVEEQIGLCTLSHIKEIASQNSARVTLSNDNKYIKVEYSNDNMDVKESYTVSSADGAVLSCSIEKNGIIVRSYYLNSIRSLKSEEIDENTFRIPD